MGTKSDGETSPAHQESANKGNIDRINRSVVKLLKLILVCSSQSPFPGFKLIWSTSKTNADLRIFPGEIQLGVSLCWHQSLSM